MARNKWRDLADRYVLVESSGYILCGHSARSSIEYLVINDNRETHLLHIWCVHTTY